MNNNQRNETEPVADVACTDWLDLRRTICHAQRLKLRMSRPNSAQANGPKRRARALNRLAPKNSPRPTSASMSFAAWPITHIRTTTAKRECHQLGQPTRLEPERTVCCCIGHSSTGTRPTLRISEPAQVTSSMQPERNRGVRCVRLVGQDLKGHVTSLPCYRAPQA